MPYSSSWGRGMLLVAPDRTHLTRARRMLPMASVFLSPSYSLLPNYLLFELPELMRRKGRQEKPLSLAVRDGRACL